ncbi:MAG: hypothetical protein ACRC20_13230 [Segniliparus sp.]|uniref:hypothetical protein n=1 Tax=Segniliparus sp. TaxID=2804064 RepID=UPI003F3F591D
MVEEAGDELARQNALLELLTLYGMAIGLEDGGVLDDANPLIARVVGRSTEEVAEFREKFADRITALMHLELENPSPEFTLWANHAMYELDRAMGSHERDRARLWASQAEQAPGSS